MIKYSKLQSLSDKEFTRLTGVNRPIFDKMLLVLQAAKEAKNKQRRYRGGRKPVVTLQSMLLMALEYWREYRTYFHIAQSYGVSEGYAFVCIRFVENTLIKHKDFRLPGRKALITAKPEETMLIDVSESPVERPKKKAKALLLWQKEKAYY